MLTALGDALGAWRPRRGGGDPLATIRGAWVELTGPQIARAAHPVALSGDTLVVVTTSSAWSQQLAFLEPAVLRSIAALGLGVAVNRLRFRAGTLRAPRAAMGAAGRAIAASATHTLEPAPATAAEALAAFRRAVERRRREHAARGGRECVACAAPIATGVRCVPCRDGAAFERAVACRRLFFEMPWLTAAEVMAAVPGLDAAAYDALRRDVLRRWWDELALARRRAAVPRAQPPDRVRLRKIAASYVLLETRIDPGQLDIDSPIGRNALGESYDFVRRLQDDVAAAERS